jgi:hypothetical protein
MSQGANCHHNFLKVPPAHSEQKAGSGPGPACFFPARSNASTRMRSCRAISDSTRAPKETAGYTATTIEALKNVCTGELGTLECIFDL